MPDVPPSRLPHVRVLRRYRTAMVLFMIGLILSGLTAFPLQREIEGIVSLRGLQSASPESNMSSFDRWMLIVRDGLRETDSHYPWVGYGTDWLAMAHLAIAVFFIGPLVHPRKNIWVLQAGLIACVMVIPVALICGEIRQIPWGWRIFDCSFGIIGALPLLYCLRQIRKMPRQQSSVRCDAD
jgi:hypothetical protein